MEVLTWILIAVGVYVAVAVGVALMPVVLFVCILILAVVFTGVADICRAIFGGK